MRKKQIMMCLAVSMMIMAGCSKTEENANTVTEPQAEAVGNMDESEDNQDSDENRDADSRAENNADGSDSSSSDTREAENEGEKKEEGKGSISDAEKLNGSVVSIDPDGKSVEVNEIITEEMEDGTSMAVELAEGGSSENSIKVRFTNDTIYTVRTVKNSGINPEDSSDSPGSFSDIKEGSTLNMEGRYEGEEFLASSVLIYVFVR